MPVNSCTGGILFLVAPHLLRGVDNVFCINNTRLRICGGIVIKNECYLKTGRVGGKIIFFYKMQAKR